MFSWRDRRRTITVACFIFVLVLTNIHQFGSRVTSPFRTNDINDVYNSTLGFEKVLVVSTNPSWRIEGLRAAANRTGIHFEVPQQPKWSTSEVDLFRGVGLEDRKSEIGPGQAQCWLGHLNVIHDMLVQNWSTALIMEDDNDWDIMIKQQLSMVAPMIRRLTGSMGSVTDSPYGDTWDLLWLGHCGDDVPATGSIVSQIDQTLPDSALYRQVYGEYGYISPQLRMVHRTNIPTCTYAYALTSRAALKIYTLTHSGSDRIITVDLREWCARGVLRCVIVNPELFHHHKKAGELSSEIAVIEGWDEIAGPEKFDYTANIRYSARCNSNSGELVTCQDEWGKDR
ncbi:putative Glycosyltransferase family 25 protein [Seiridium cardinale]